MSGISGAGGIESSQPQEQIESAEKSTEIREAAESIEKAALKPEEKIEEGDFQAAENLEEAFKAAVPPPEQAATTAAVTASPGIEISEVSSEAPSRTETSRTAESNAEEFLEEAGQPEMQAAVETVLESESAEQTQSQAVSDLETVERDASETKLVKDGGDDDKFDPDDGLERDGDIREDTDISNQYGDDVIETGDGVDTLRDPGKAGTGIDDLPDTIGSANLGVFNRGEGGGTDPGDLKGPDVGLNQDGERGDLAGAAAFGSDSRIGMDDQGKKDNDQPDLDPPPIQGGPRDATISAEDGGGDDGGGSDTSPNDSGGKPAVEGDQTDKDGLEGSRADAPLINQLQDALGKAWDTITSDSDDSSPATAVIGGTRGTPTPDGVEQVEFDDSLDGKLREKALPSDSIFDQDLNGEAVSQPVDEDDANPKDPGIAFDRATQTDPYSQDTVDDDDVPSTGYEPDVDKLTPGMAGGDDGVLSPSSGIVDPDEVGPDDPDKPSGEGPKPTKPD